MSKGGDEDSRELGGGEEFKEWFDLECHEVDSTNGTGWIELASSREESRFFKKRVTLTSILYFLVSGQYHRCPFWRQEYSRKTHLMDHAYSLSNLGHISWTKLHNQ